MDGIRRVFDSNAQQEIEMLNEVNQQQETTNVSPSESLGLSTNDSIESFQKPPLVSATTGTAPFQGVQLPDLQRMPTFPPSYSRNDNVFAMILNYLGVGMSPDDIRSALDVMETPDRMIELARDHGLQAEQYNNASLDDLKKFTDQGLPVMAAVSLDGNTKEFVVVTGHRIDDKRNPPMEVIQFRDAQGKTHEWPTKYFQEAWAKGGNGSSGVETGYQDFMMVFAPDGTDLPSSDLDGAQASSGVNEGMYGMSKGWDLMANGDGVGAKVHGVFDMLGGTIGCIGSGLGWMLCSAPAQYIKGSVDGIPVLQNVVKPLCDLWDTAGAMIGDVFKGVNDAFDHIGGAFQALGNGDFSGFVGGVADAAKDVGGAVVDTVSDAVGGTVDAVEDIFSW
jgi:hypothetical protein